MAITITKAPTAFYPAYNDSWMEFTSTLSNNNKAEITITGYPVFTLYPQDGKYTFNLKEIAKYEVNKTGFKDVLTTSGAWGYSSENGYLSLTLNVKVYSTSSSENTNKTYTFFKYVKQIGESIYNNNGQILLPSENGVDFSATYWEGFPFDFSLQRIGGIITVKNLNTTQTSSGISPTVTGIMRVFVDKGGSAANWTDTSFLPLASTVNRLEIYDGGVFKSNLNLKKLNKDCGVYLKWFNPQGGYSYFLFDEYFTESLRASDMGSISQNNFLNIGDTGLSGALKSLGKQSTKTLKLKAMVDSSELKHLEGLFNSPSVQMYSSKRAYEEGNWIDVEVKTAGLPNNNKKDIHSIDVDVELPELINTIL